LRAFGYLHEVSQARDALIGTFTETLHGIAWRQCQEQNKRSGDLQACPGTTEIAAEGAALLAGALEKANGISIDALLSRAVEADGHPEEEDRYLVEFGHAIVHQALTGEAIWFRKHKRFSIVVPKCAFGYKSPAEYERAGSP
jgi:hypothetical protein